jgi:mycofactocin precursor
MDETTTLTADPELDAVSADADATDDGEVEEELLIEEVSIDGMCGVY